MVQSCKIFVTLQKYDYNCSGLKTTGKNLFSIKNQVFTNNVVEWVVKLLMVTIIVD